MLSHGTDPVSIDEWVDVLKVRTKEVSCFDDEVRGIYLAPRGQRLILINRDLPQAPRNEAWWHEIGHCLLGHHELVALCTVDSWWRSRIERAAEKTAGTLALPDSFLAKFGIVPDRTMPGGWNLPLRDDIIRDVAEAAAVTVEMVFKRLGMVHHAMAPADVSTKPVAATEWVEFFHRMEKGPGEFAGCTDDVG